MLNAQVLKVLSVVAIAIFLFTAAGFTSAAYLSDNSAWQDSPLIRSQDSTTVVATIAVSTVSQSSSEITLLAFAQTAAFCGWVVWFLRPTRSPRRNRR